MRGLPPPHGGNDEQRFRGNQIMKYPKMHSSNVTGMTNVTRKKRKVKAGQSERTRQDVKLPPMSSAYLQPPRLRGNGERSRLKQLMDGYNDKNRKRMCGICGILHAPGEPHKSRRARDFNQKNGMSRLTVHAGSVPARTRGTEPDRERERPQLRAMMAIEQRKRS